jgi:hypothetical protein
MVRLGLESLVNATGRLADRVGGARPGRKVLTLVAAILAGGSHIDHADRLRAGATQKVLPFRVMAPSTLGTFLRSFSFGHVRQLDAVIAETIRRVWKLGAGPGAAAMTIDLDSTICEEVARFVVELRAGWASVVRLCDGFGVVEGSGLEGRGEGGELPVAFDSAVLLFGGEEARGGPAQAHVGGPFAV